MSPYVKAMLLLIVLTMATPLLGQVPTGRHRPVAVEQDKRSGEETFTDRKWFFSAGAGAMASGSLFQVRSDGPVRWQSPRGEAFQPSRDFTVMLDEDFDLAVTLGRQLGSRYWLRLNLSTTRMNMRARVRVGEGVRFYLWDQMDIVVLGLDVEHRLTALDRHPYLLLGCAGVAVRGGADSAIDQTRLAIRFGGGYNLQLNPIWGLRAEIRNNLASLDLSKLDPQIAFGEQPTGKAVDGKSPHHFWEILVKFVGSF